MLIDIQIADSLELQIKAAVSRHKFEHVVEKTDAGRNPSFATAVQIQLQAHLGFIRLALNSSGARHR
jgi:hypothetical protein